MNTEKTLIDVEKLFGIKIRNAGDKDIILFDVPFEQPFRFGIRVLFSGITNQEQFIVNVPALNVKDVKEFASQVNIVSSLVSILNKMINDIRK